MVYACLTPVTDERHFNASAEVGLGIITLSLLKKHRPLIYVMYTVLLFLSIPLKKWLDADRPRSHFTLDNCIRARIKLPSADLSLLESVI